ncbi:MAG: N-acetylmuramoyl-L-alanine amidase [Treponema sp.]|jgi:N-acetylmuramoyl-L-alanine amidase|nr:N-acetylmuramoyl-L-alanine amidase [Treponema sp.]
MSGTKKTSHGDTKTQSLRDNEQILFLPPFLAQHLKFRCWANASVRGFSSIFLFFILTFSIFAQTNKNLNLDEALIAMGGVGKVEFRWDPFFASGTFSIGDHQAAFVSGKQGETRTVLFDYRDVLTLPMPFVEKGNIFFPEIFITQVRHTFNRYIEEDRSRFRIAAIIIDPGHGGRAPGTEGKHTIQGKSVNLREKEINLIVARQVYASLAIAFPDKRLLITREGDTNPSLEDRVELANSVTLAENEVAIYVSIHCNGSPNANARGFEVWYLSPGYRREVLNRSRYEDTKEIIPILNSMLEEELTTESILLARHILRRIDESVGKTTPSRGLKAEEWFVVRNAKMPSVLVELPFLTNEADALLMSDEAYLKKLSEALYKGISDFIAFFERSGGFTAQQ